jgi:transposase
MARESFKSRIVKLRLEQPNLSYRQVAAIIGCSKHSVSRTCFDTGLQSGRGVLSLKDAYLRVREEHPDWSGHKIAKHLGCSSATVYRWENRIGRERIIALGEAAARAGLTVKQIEGMANARHV